jgi:DNA-directed RNA polymerase I, II, and III subunit RPABC1
MKDESVSNAILVLRGDITPFAKQAVQEMSDSFRIEHFKEAELLVDITDHILVRIALCFRICYFFINASARIYIFVYSKYQVPEHLVLSQNEKQELLKRYRLRDTQLPRIQPNDPVARYYGMKRGQVVKIIRPSETAGRYVTYRICM